MPNNIEALRKWEPILDILNVKDDKVRLFMAEYAEHHHGPTVSFDEAIKETRIYSEIDPYGEEDWTDEVVESDAYKNMEVLPMSLKVISMLNLKDKNLFIEENQPIINVSTKIKRSEIMSMTEVGADIIGMVENILINELTSILNRKLEKARNFYVDKMVESMSLTTDQDMNPIITLKSKCRVE